MEPKISQSACGFFYVFCQVGLPRLQVLPHHHPTFHIITLPKFWPLSPLIAIIFLDTFIGLKIGKWVGKRGVRLQGGMSWPCSFHRTEEWSSLVHSNESKWTRLSQPHCIAGKGLQMKDPWGSVHLFSICIYVDYILHIFLVVNLSDLFVDLGLCLCSHPWLLFELGFV